MYRGGSMYKVLIVDDEKLERRGIAFLLKESGFDCEISEADNGIQALEYISNNSVDILLTDVKMPLMDGIELITKVNELERDIKIIIFSGCSDFNYARQAVRLGVSDYILKPVDPEEFSEAVTRIVTELEKTRVQTNINTKSKEYIMEHILYLATSGSNLNDINEYGSENISMDFLNEYHCLIMLDFNTDFFGGKGIDFKEKFVCDTDEYTYLNLNTHQSLFFFKDLEADYVKKAEGLIGKVFVKYGEKCFAAVSSVFEGCANMSKAMEELDTLMENKFYYKPGEVFYTGMNINDVETVSVDDDTIMKQMKQSLKMKDANGLRVHFESFCQKYRNKTNFSQVYIKFLFANLLKDFNQSLPEADEVVLNEEIEELYKATDFSTVIKIVNDNIDRLEEDFMKNPQMHKEVEIIKEYIYDHYGEELGIDKLADMVFMAPSYFSSLFKKETGQNLSKFIKAYRMERAKDMLENTTTKIFDIGTMCGYPNVSYFCSSFREYYGISPQKYRESGEEMNNNE